MCLACMYGWLFCMYYVCMYIPSTCLMCRESTGCWMSQNSCYRLLWAILWVIETEPILYNKSIQLLTLWATSSVPNFTIFFKSQKSVVYLELKLGISVCFAFRRCQRESVSLSFWKPPVCMASGPPFFSVTLMAVLPTSGPWLFCLHPLQKYLWLSGYAEMIPEDLRVFRSTVGNLNSTFDPLSHVW